MFGNGHPVFAISSWESHDACNPSVGRHRVYFKLLKRRRLARKTKCCEVKNGSSMRAGLDERATDEEMSKVYECALPFALSPFHPLISLLSLSLLILSFLRFPTSLPTRSSILSLWPLPILLSFPYLLFCACASERVHMFLCVPCTCSCIRACVCACVKGGSDVTQRTMFPGQYLCTSELGNSRPAHRLPPLTSHENTITNTAAKIP